MRIVEVCLTNSLGGLELYFEKCCRWFDRSSHYCVPLVIKNSRLEERLKQENIPCLTLSSRSRGLSMFNAYKLANIIENHNIDIVHIHDKRELPIVAFAKMICRKKFKLAHTRHMQMPHSKKDLWHKFLYNKIDLFIAITDELKKDIIKLTPVREERIKKLYIGVKAPEGFDSDKCKLFFKGHRHNVFKIAVFNTLEHLKGQQLVVEAAQLLKDKYPHVEYFFVGDAMFKDYVDKLKTSIDRYGMNDIVHIKGFYPAPMEIMPCFDLILMPSYNETFDLVPVEAMRCGVAVIGTDYAGITEVIDHNETGLLFKKGDHLDLKEKMELLISNDTLRTKLAQKGKNKADKDFNEEDHFHSLTNLFAALI